MSKVAGIHNKSPETYPTSPTVSNILETLRQDVSASPTLFGTSFTSILAGLLSFTPSVNNAKAIVMVSGVIESPSAGNNIITLQIVLDPSGSDIVELTVVLESLAGSPAEPVPFSMVVETASLGVSAPQTIDVQAKTTSGTAVAADVSTVIMVTSA